MGLFVWDEAGMSDGTVALTRWCDPKANEYLPIDPTKTAVLTL